MSGLRLLAVHAHPDDESSKGAATMAKYVAEGNQVMVVTCTGGERGSILNPRMKHTEISGTMPELRRQEMQRAAQALGIEHRWLGYVDSGLPEGDPLPPLPQGCFALEDDREVAARLVEIVREFRPHVMITYDENGDYPHPDHIKTHVVSMLAWEHAGDPEFAPEAGERWTPLKLYYVYGFPMARVEKLSDYLSGSGRENPFQAFVEKRRRRGDNLATRITTHINAADFFEKRNEALRAHATQIDPDGLFFAVPVDVEKSLWPTEEFELARTRVETSLPETDLFAGIRNGK